MQKLQQQHPNNVSCHDLHDKNNHQVVQMIFSYNLFHMLCHIFKVITKAFYTNAVMFHVAVQDGIPHKHTKL